MNPSIFIIWSLFHLFFYSCYGGLSPKYKNQGNKALNISSKIYTISVLGESRCPDTTRFFNNHFAKFVSEFGDDKNVKMNYIPFGKASCKKVGDDYECVCQHKLLECQLNALQNCVKDAYQNKFKDYFPIVHCIQGKTSIDDAASQCFTNISKKLSKALKQCGSGKKGRKLLAEAEKVQLSKAPNLNFVPWIIINSERNEDVFHTGFEKSICENYLTDSSAPAACSTYMYNQILTSINSEKRF